MKKRVGILTSGGDCPGLNATIRGVAKALYARFGENVEIVGILNGYHGLITGEYKEMCEDDFRGILTLGGTILGTKRTPFKLMRVVEEDKIDKVAAMKKTYKDAKLDCLLCLGGNGTHKTANLLSQEGLNIIGLPKTIDNDIYGTDVTFGFHTAVDIATEVIDRIHTTAGSHSRVMCIEIMGNKAGWLTLYSGIAGGADIILLPEQPYDIDRVCAAVERRARKGSNFSIIAVAEGAINTEEAKMKRKEWMAKRLEAGTGTTATNRIAAKCDVFMPGLSEGQLFSGLTDPRAIADYYLDMGVRQVVIKLGAEGSALFERDESGARRETVVPSFEVDVVDTVGAGDGFASGVITSLLEGLDDEHLLERANAVGAIQVTSVSDSEGLPTAGELAEFIANTPRKEVSL